VSPFDPHSLDKIVNFVLHCVRRGRALTVSSEKRAACAKKAAAADNHLALKMRLVAGTLIALGFLALHAGNKNANPYINC
jgi:hypothetical protein